MKQVAGRLKGDLAQFRELAAFAQFGSELDATTQAKIDRGKRIIELFNQPQHNPIPVEIQVAILWMVQNGLRRRRPAWSASRSIRRRLTEYPDHLQGRRCSRTSSDARRWRRADRAS